jgi:hypothetical protein
MMDEEERKNHCYLGDAVYAEKSGEFIILRTSSHRDSECDNKIYLEESVLISFLEWINRVVVKKQ